MESVVPSEKMNVPLNGTRGVVELIRTSADWRRVKGEKVPVRVM